MKSIIFYILVCCGTFTIYLSIVISIARYHKSESEIRGDQSQFIEVEGKQDEWKITRLDRATHYNAEVEQCNADPLTTADMSRIDPVILSRGEISWCALSRDLLTRWGGEIDYGDTIIVISSKNININGIWVVHDTMHSRWKKTIDFLVCKTDKKRSVGLLINDVIIVHKIKTNDGE